MTGPRCSPRLAFWASKRILPIVAGIVITTTHEQHREGRCRGGPVVSRSWEEISPSPPASSPFSRVTSLTWPKGFSLGFEGRVTTCSADGTAGYAVSILNA